MIRVLVPAFVLFSAVALGEEAPAAGPSDAAAAGFTVLEMILGTLGTAITGAIIYFVKIAAKKAGFELSEKMESMVRSQADNVIDGVEAWAAKKAAAGDKPTSEMKLTRGVKMLDAVMEATGIKGKISDKVANIIEERLRARHNDKNSEMTLKGE